MSCHRAARLRGIEPFLAMEVMERAFALERSGVATTPGIDFGEAGEGFLRFCYAAAEEQIAEALERLAPVLRELA